MKNSDKMGAAMASKEWQQHLNAILPAYGHRNWIVVADSAYPAQSKPGIETVVTGAEQIEVTRTVLAAVRASRHVRANVYVDRELEFVADNDAPGAEKYRNELAVLLNDANRIPLIHEDIIAKLDAVSQVFRVLILKTEMAIPYTSVFFELGCSYWPREAEQRMRAAMAAASK
jgi:L-fucose mutarotase/ribose pyranase (RbsD/FucU family)